MAINVHDNEINEWGEIVNKPFLNEHINKQATSTESGHVKIDEVTIVTDVDGKIKVSDDILDSTLTSTQRRITLSTGQNVIPIDTPSYTPDTHIELLFNNTIKVFRDEYVISPSTTSSSGYEITLTTPVSSDKTFELVLIYGKALSIGGESDSRFHDGSTPPTDTSLVWNKTP